MPKEPGCKKQQPSGLIQIEPLDEDPLPPCDGEELGAKTIVRAAPKPGYRRKLRLSTRRTRAVGR